MSHRMIDMLVVIGVVLAGCPDAPAQSVGQASTTARGLIAIDKVANKIRFYDPETLTERRVIDSPGASVHELSISHDRKTAYVPLYGDGIYGNNPNPNNKILIVDLSSMTIAGTIDLGMYRAPHGLAAARDGLLWAVCEMPRKLLLIDPVRRTVSAAYDSPGHGPHFIMLLPNQTRAYVSNKEGDLGVFDVASRRFVAPVAMPNAVDAGGARGSEGLAAAPDGTWFVVADNDRSELHVIDVATHAEIDRVPLGEMPPTNAERTRLVRLAFSPDGKHLVATGYATGQVWIIDATDLRRQTVIAVAKGPQGIAFSPDGRSVIVSSHDNGLLTRIDLDSKKIIDSVDGGGGIEVLAFY